MPKKLRPPIEITCPCCEAKLTVDTELAVVLSHVAPPKTAPDVDISDAARILAEQARRREVKFRDSWEAGVGAKWDFVPTERMWLSAELMRTVNAPYSGTFTPYTAGMTAWVPMVQAIIAF